MASPTLIFCGGKNKRFAEIAIEAGFLYGAQLPCQVFGPVYFADQNWKRPNRIAYMSALKEHQPTMASVRDWETERDLTDILHEAEEAAQYVQIVMIIPKVHGGVSRLPRAVGGKPVRLGYSVPTSHGGTNLFLSEFLGWPIHLLGGSPQAQMVLARYLDVRSVDGNMAMKMATMYCSYFVRDSRIYRRRGHWPTLLDADGVRWDGGDGHFEAFRRSCVNIRAAWEATT